MNIADFWFVNSSKTKCVNTVFGVDTHFKSREAQTLAKKRIDIKVFFNKP